MEVKELGDQGHSSESQQDQRINLSKSLHLSKSSLPPLAREVGENTSSFLLKGGTVLCKQDGSCPCTKRGTQLSGGRDM